MKKFIAYALLLSASVASQAQSLWGGTSYGMTLEQVRKKHPTAEKQNEPEKQKNGSEGLLKVPGIEIAQSKFSAIFFFRNNKLSEVWLTLDEHGTYEVYEQLRQALRSKYGKEIDAKEERSAIASTSTSTWQSGKTNITALAIRVGTRQEIGTVVNVIYEMRIAKNASKL